MNPHHTIGDSTLRAWRTGLGLVWVQTTDPKHTRRLSQRRDRRLVGEGVAGDYLRIFSFRHGMAWARVETTLEMRRRLMREPASARWVAEQGQEPSNSIEDVKGVTQ